MMDKVFDRDVKHMTEHLKDAIFRIHKLEYADARLDLLLVLAELEAKLKEKEK